MPRRVCPFVPRRLRRNSSGLHEAGGDSSAFGRHGSGVLRITLSASAAVIIRQRIRSPVVSSTRTNFAGSSPCARTGFLSGGSTQPGDQDQSWMNVVIQSSLYGRSRSRPDSAAPWSWGPVPGAGAQATSAGHRGSIPACMRSRRLIRAMRFLDKTNSSGELTFA